ncbi:phage tail tape measure protein [Rhodococcus hoagii]|nr:phage tail tape measure protein [Prescottella equi]
MAGGRIDIEVRPDLKGFNTQLETGLRGAVGTASKIGGLIGVSLGAGVAFQKVIALGNDYTNTLNTMQAVSQATGDQMAKISERAKQLGNDASLPNTSAADAAMAMTELAKGGFSVQQSMDAAKGTLQLAAAAQIDAASAATVQSQALQAFSLDASNAAHVADVLANVSNASAGEMTDFAQGLQQAGTVANGFGVSIEDTSATLGMLANAGIQGSDAGTLLKTSLLALTDQGNPAQGAIEELGLTVYDTTGKFVGMRSLLEQLKTASSKMTEEQYQAATATLFGSDAMRMASIAAKDGVASWDAMRTAIDRQGAAADVAAAKTQGLPGAIASVQNSAETLALELYDLVDGPLESFAKGAADKISDVTPAIVDGLSTAGSVVGNVASAFMSLDPALQATAIAAIGLKATGLGGFLADLGGRGVASLRGFNDQLNVQQNLAQMSGQQVGRLTSALGVLESRVPAIAKMGDAYRTVAGPAAAFASQQAAIASVSGPLTGAFRSAAGEAVRFGGVMGGTVAAGVRGAGTAIGGVVSAFGGPWAAGLAAAGIGLTAWMTTVAEARNLTKQYDDAVRRVGVSQSELGDIFARSKGAFDDMAIANVTSQVADLSTQLESAAANDARWTNVTSDIIGDIVKGGGSGDDISKDMDRRALAAREAMQAIRDLGMSDEQVARAMADNATWSDVTAKLRGMGEGGKKAADDLNAMRTKVLEIRSAAENTTPGFFGLTEAVKTLSSESATAADRTSALKTALDILSGKPIDAGAAMQSYNRQVRETAEATKEAWDQSQGWAQALRNADGSVNTQTANGDRLLTQLNQIKEASIQAAASGAEMGPIWAQNEEQFQRLAAATGLTVDQIRQMSVEAGLVPKDLSILASLKGAGSVQQELTTIRGLLAANANGVEIPTEAITDETKARLREVGVKIDEVNGKPGIVKLSAPNQAALDAIQAVIDKSIPNKTFTIIADSQGAEARLRAFGATNIAGPLPAIRLNENAAGGRLPGFAGGGRMPPRSAVDDIYAITPGGVPIAKVNGDEWVINDEMSEEYDRELAMINAGTFPKLPGFENGGRIAAQRAHAGLAAENGKPYGYGQVGNPSWDCSSYSGLAYALLKGLDTAVRWYTTESNFLGLGFRPGTGPSSALNIGVHNGGGGPNSHMTSMLDGVAFESSSQGVQYGSGAARPTDSQFEKQYHLPASQFSPPGDSSGSGAGFGVYGRESKKATWTEKDELSLESARIAITQAQEARDRTNANGKKSQADRDQADSKVRRAEERVRALEAKKRAAETGANATAAPPAPELTTSFTDKQIRLKELEWAIDEADQKRNEVYDDPDATAKDRERADIDLVRAMNALAAEQKEQRGDTGTIGDILGDAAKSAVTETLGSSLDFFGISGDRLLSLKASDVGGMVPPSFTEAEIARQGPEVPGTSDWAKEMIERFNLPAPSNTPPQELLAPAAAPGTQEWVAEMLKRLNPVPTFLRDMGGALPNGAAALNLSGETEWVQTAADRRRYEVDMRDLAALRAQATSTGVAPAQLDSMIQRLERIASTPRGPLLHVENINGHDINEATRAAGREALRVSRSESLSGGW